MGKAVIVLVLGVSVIISVLIINLNANSNRGLSTTIDYYKSTQARLIANSGVEVYLEKMRRNKTLKGTFNNNSLFQGNYNINIWGPDSALKIKSVSTFFEKTHNTLVTAKRTPVKLPNVNSALYISSSNINLNLNGNVDINGSDHNMNGTLGAGTPLPGVGVDTPADSAFVVNDISTKISKSILGYGATPSVYTVNDNTDWKALTEACIFSADTVLATGTYSSGSVFGTITKPIITYASGNVDFTDATGYGIMVVNGNINLSGNFRFYGILIAYGQSTIRTQTIGNNGIYGSTILVGENIILDSQGNSKFYYSLEAIQNAQINLKSSRFEIVSWWE